MQETDKRRKIPDDYNHLEDKALKTAAQFFGEELLANFGVHEKVVSVAPTEIVHLEARHMYEDFNLVMENGAWYHFEFESDSITLDDLKRFREYEASTSRVYQVPVITFVVCSSRVRSLRSEFTEGLNTYRVKVIRLKDQDADTVFRDLFHKKSDDITKEDLVTVLLTPLMGGTLPEKERIQLGFRMLKDAEHCVPEEELKKMQAVLYALAVKVLKETELEEIEEAIGMTILGQMLMEKGMEKGISSVVTTCRELGLDQNRTREQLMRKFQMTDVRAKEAVEKYWEAE